MKHKELIDSVLYKVLVFLMGFMVLNVLWQVASRFILRSPSSFTDELARFLLIWVGLLGASYVSGQKMHLAIDILPTKLTGQKERNLNAVINVLVGLFALFAMVWGGAKLVYITFILDQNSAALNVPLAYVYTVLPLSGLLITYYSIINIFEKPAAPEVQGTEGIGLK